MSKTINLGAVTAYADAVAAGYTGTREEFAQDLANAATYAAESHQSAETASDAAETATAAASAASLDADAAHDDAATAHSDAEAALSFKTAAETAATTASTKSGEAANSASQAATSASGAAGSATAASGSATAAAGSAANAAASETAAAGSATSAAGSASAAAQTLVDVNAAGATQVAAIAAKGEEVLESIPADYTTLSNDVDDLKSDLNNSVSMGNGATAWEQGLAYRSSNSGKMVFSASDTKCRLVTIISASTTDVMVKSGYAYAWYVCTKSGNEYTPVQYSAVANTDPISFVDYIGYYLILVASKTSEENITPTEALANVSILSHVAAELVFTQNDIDDINANVETIEEKLSDAKYSYDLTGLFESGTAYLNSNSAVVYGVTDNCVRVKANTSLPLKKDDIIAIKNSGFNLRVIKLGTPNTSVGFLSDDYVIPENGNYIVVFADANAQTTTVDAVLSKVSIIYGSSQISKKIISIDEEIANLDERVTNLETPAIDNHARGVFGIMTYNVGCWYNGTGVNVPTDKYNAFLTLQKNIFNLYKPDILCLQEYRDVFSSGHDAAQEILDPMYHFVETAKGNTTYDGKAICTSMTLENAQNVEFVTSEGNLQRNYEKAYIYCNGKKVCVISTHLALIEANNALECTELLQAIANEDYVIICMDSNVNSDPTGSAYAQTLKQFTDAGLTLANQGQYITAPDGNWTIDNIAVSSNITIKSVVVDKQKENLEEGADHYPFIVYAEIF